MMRLNSVETFHSVRRLVQQEAVLSSHTLFKELSFKIIMLHVGARIEARIR